MNSRYKKQDNRHRCQTRNADAVLVRYIRNSQDRCYAEGGDQAVDALLARTLRVEHMAVYR